MNLEILSLGEALEYEPREKSYAIRVASDRDYNSMVSSLRESSNWVGINNYYFDDAWPKDWKEFSWVDVDKCYFTGEFNGTFAEIKKVFPNITKESLMMFYEAIGHSYGGRTLFDDVIAKKILDDYEEVSRDVENIMIHCRLGENRSPAIGIAMNEIYDWKISGLKERFPSYRRFVYDKMLKVAKER